MSFLKAKLLFVAILILGITSIHAQTNPNEYVEEKPVLMKNEATFGLNTHTSGIIGVQVRKGINITGYKKWILEGDFIGMRHPKEIRTVNPYYDNAKSYVYGKINTFNILRLGAGLQRSLYSKAERNGVEIRMVSSAGLSLGIAKPVYLDILVSVPGKTGEHYVVTEKYDPERHQLEDIYGRAPFTKGMDQLRFHPGAYGRIGFNFEYAPIFEDVKAIEIGAILDAYPKEIPIMAFIENKQLFLTFYITVMYGRKW